MPEHAAGDTSKFNELIPQALQQTLYTKNSKMYKRQKTKSIISATFHSQVSIFKGEPGNLRATGEWIPFPARSVQFNR